MKKKQILILTMSIIVLLTSIILSVNSSGKENETKKVSFYTSESLLSEDKLIDASEIIVKGKITKLKDKKNASMDATTKSGKNFKVEFPYSIYAAEIKEALKGSPETKEVDVVFVVDKPDYIKLGEEYILFLEKNNINKDKYYSMVSYSQGFYEPEYYDEEDTYMWTNKQTNKKFKENSLIKKINK